MPHSGDVVVAILDHGREEAFVVHTLEVRIPPRRITRPVYTVTDFSYGPGAHAYRSPGRFASQG